MRHRNYHEVEGSNPAECGRQLGRLFGPIVRDYIEYGRDTCDWAQYRRDADDLLSVTARYFPHYIEELEAYAAAAGVSLLDLWTMSIEDELGDDDSEKCTTVITNDGRLIAHNEDWDADSSDDICILKKRCGDVTTLELYYYGSPLGGTALSICSRGYAQAINSLSHADWQEGVPKIVMGRRISELQDTGPELAKLLTIPRSSGFAHSLVDRDGRVTLLESTAKHHVLQQPQLPFVHTNHIVHPKLAEFEGDHDGKSTFRRYDAACGLVCGEMGETSMMRLMSDDSGGKNAGILNRKTIARAIVDLDRRVAKIWLKREQQKGWIDYPIDFFFADYMPSV